jgi:hypothetical protein
MLDRRPFARAARAWEDAIMADEARVFTIDPNEVDRYARAIARIVERGHAAGSVELERAVNTYGTAFQLLVMRRGAEYGRALGMAAGDRALALVEQPEAVETLVSGDIGDIHERVCLLEEEAQAREREGEEGESPTR